MELKDFFKQYNKIALAFSGGSDSALLLYSAVTAGADVTAYYVKSAFQPQFELDDAHALARQLGAKMKVIEIDVLSDEEICSNSANRCYHCKKKIFSAIFEQAKVDGYGILIDGTNASDNVSERPGMAALKELGVLSPLRLCEITKSQVRKLSKAAGLFTAGKPSYSCLATRTPLGQKITAFDLRRTEWAESYLFSLGFSGFRVRTVENSAKIELPNQQFLMMIENKNKIVCKLKERYNNVLLDLEARNE